MAEAGTVASLGRPLRRHGRGDRMCGSTRPSFGRAGRAATTTGDRLAEPPGDCNGLPAICRQPSSRSSTMTDDGRVA
jgi:hypothetical protein